MPDKVHLKKQVMVALILLIFSAISVFAVHPYQCVNSEKLVFLKTSVDGSLYSGDYLLKEKQYYYTCFDKILAGMVTAFGMDIPSLLFFCYSVSIYLTFLGIYLITKRLFGKTEIAILSLFFFLFANKASLGGVSALGTVFTERTAALPMLLFALHFFLGKRYRLSYLLQGMAFLVHPLSASYVVAMLFVPFLFGIRQTGIRTFTTCTGLFSLIISPMLVWKMLHSPEALSMFHADPEWLELLRLRSPHHVFPFSWGGGEFLREGLLLAVFFLTWRHKPAPEHHRVILCSMSAIFLMWIAGTMFTEFLPLPVVIQFQLFRSSTWLVYFAVIYFAHHFAMTMSEEKRLLPKTLLILAAVGIFYGPYYRWFYDYAIFVLISGLMLCHGFFPSRSLANPPLRGARGGFSDGTDGGFRKTTPPCAPLKGGLAGVSAWAVGIFRKRGREGLSTAAVFVCIALLLGGGHLAWDGFAFSMHTASRENDWSQVQQWAKRHTGFEDRFIVPPNVQTSFRDESERAIYGDWKDGTQMFFNPAFGHEWIRRMEALGYRRDMPLRSFENLDLLGEHFKNLGESDFLGIAEELAAGKGETFLVMFGDRERLDFPERYRNGKYIVYKVGPPASLADSSDGKKRAL